VRRGGAWWRDEAVTYDMARRGLPDMWATLGHNDAVHGLYYLVVHGLLRVFNDADPLLVLRLPSVLAVAVACGLVALLGRRLAGPRAGLLSGIAFALLPPVQWYAQEARSYAMVCALVVWATHLLLRAVREGTRGAWAAYAAVVLAACLLHEFAVLALAAHAVAVPARTRRAWLGASWPVCAALTPLAVLSSRQSDQVAWIGGLRFGAVAAFAGVAALGVLCAWAAGPGTGPVRLPVLGLALLVLPALLLILVSLVKPLYVDRYVLYGHAGTALLIGAALDRLISAGVRVRACAVLAAGAALLALLPSMVHQRTPASRTDDVTAVARAVAEAAPDADGVLYTPSRRRVWSYPDPAPFRGLRDLALDRAPSDSHTLYGTEVGAPELPARMLAARRILTLGDPEGQPLDGTAGERAKRRVLAAYFAPCRTWHVGGARLTLHARPGHCPRGVPSGTVRDHAAHLSRAGHGRGPDRLLVPRRGPSLHPDGRGLPGVRGVAARRLRRAGRRDGAAVRRGRLRGAGVGRPGRAPGGGVGAAAGRRRSGHGAGGADRDVREGRRGRRRRPYAGAAAGGAPERPLVPAHRLDGGVPRPPGRRAHLDEGPGGAAGRGAPGDG
jgi:mannosyltransferase